MVAAGAALLVSFPLAAQASAQGALLSCDASQFSEQDAVYGTLTRCDDALAAQAPARVELHMPAGFGTGSASVGFLGLPTTGNGTITWRDGQVSQLEGTIHPGLPSLLSSRPSDFSYRVVQGSYLGATIDIDGTVASGIPGTTATFYNPTKVTIKLP